MSECRINKNLCRICGCKNENGQSLCDNDELLHKVHETFSMLVSKIQTKQKFIKNERIFFFVFLFAIKSNKYIYHRYFRLVVMIHYQIKYVFNVKKMWTFFTWKLSDFVHWKRDGMMMCVHQIQRIHICRSNKILK